MIIKPTNPLLPPTTARSLLHPTNVAYGLNLSKTIHYTHAPLVYYYICRKKYLSICRNPLFIHNISLPNQYASANSDFPAIREPSGVCNTDLRGHSSNTFSWEFDPHPPPRNANNVERYTFVMHISGKADTPYHPQRYLTLECPLKTKMVTMMISTKPNSGS